MRLTGVELIAIERKRHKNVEGWTEDHDDDHIESELAYAAAVYAIPPEERKGNTTDEGFIPELWPENWSEEWYKPTEDRIKELIKAGALIAAEIDRLQRQED